jgi:DNA-binding NtrC family response regulator
LNERAEDIPELAKYFIHRYGKELGLDTPSVQPEAISFLQSQLWPGNVRELENVVRQALLAARPFGISLEHVQQVLVKTRKPVAAPNNPTRLTSPNCSSARKAAKSITLTRA